ncbi:MAG: TenA family transcriptional regulator [Stellaceae bacterium]
MTLHDRLLAETETARGEFLSIPLLGRALEGKVSRTLYIDFLKQAYHHVRHTCPLLSLAAAKTQDSVYRASLYTYIEEERGHEEWILSDIAALGSDAEGVAQEAPRPACRAMVGYAYYAIEWISPYALLGMVHVLEGMSTQLATKAATALRTSFGPREGDGFRYLISHGALDTDHTAFFRDLVNQLPAPAAAEVIIDCAKTMYWLYGNIFRGLEQELKGDAGAAQG